MESLSHNFAQGQIVMIHGVIGNGPQLGYIYLSVFPQNSFLHTDIDDLAHQTTGFFVIGNHFALQRHRQLVDEGRIHKFGFCGMETGLVELPGLFIAGNDAHIVTCRHALFGGHGHGEGPTGDQILGSLVAGIDTNGDFLLLADAALGSVHGVGSTVSIVCCDDINGHGIAHGLGTEVFSHGYISYH